MAAALVETSSRIFKFGGHRTNNNQPHCSNEQPGSCRASIMAVAGEHEVVGYVIHRGRKTHLPHDRPVVFDRIGRRILVLSQLGAVKVDIPLLDLMLLRVNQDRNSVTKLEVVWREGKIMVNLLGASEDAHKYYKKLQKARIEALRVEEEKQIDQPKYIRGASRSAYNPQAKAEKGMGLRLLSSLNSRKTV